MNPYLTKCANISHDSSLLTNAAKSTNQSTAWDA
jgi:hypothetical protein